MSFDEILNDIGGVGCFQIIILFSLAFPKIVPCGNILMPIFVSFERTFNCTVNEDDDNGQGRNLSDTCSQISLTNDSSTSCPLNSLHFDSTVVDSTLQSQYFLICEREYLTALSSSVFFVGTLTGSFLYGVLSDRFGRMKTLSLLSFKSLIVGAALPFAPNIWLYILGRLLIGIFCGGLLTVSNVTFIEFMPASQRLKLQMIFSYSWPLGYGFYILLGYFIRNHQYLQLALQTLAIPGCFFVFIFPESPRWLLAKNRQSDAFKATHIIAKYNKRTITQENFDEKISQIKSPLLTKELEVTELEEVSNAQHELSKPKDLKSLLKNRWFFIVTFINWVNFMSIAMMDLTLIYFTNKLGGNIYLNLLFMALVEIPGILIILIVGRYVGRVTLLMVGFYMCLCVAVTLSIFYKKPEYEIVCIITAVVGKFFTSSILNIYWVYCLEAYPTVIRNSIVGSCVTFASVGPMLVPFVIQTEKWWTPAPFVIISTFIFTCAVNSIFLPETKDHQTLETVDQGITFVQTQQIWRKKKNGSDVLAVDMEEKNQIL